MTILRTARLVLRPAAESDAAFLVQLLNEPGWQRFIGDRGVRDLHDARRYVAVLRDHHERGGHGLLIMTEAGRPVGTCGLVRRPLLPWPDLGFALLRDACGRGLAREAATEVLRHAHDELGLARVLAVAARSNERSLKLLEGLGFRHEGRVRLQPEQGRAVVLGHDAPALRSHLAARFDDLWRSAGAPGDPAPWREDLLDRWSEPHRAYHALRHLDESLRAFDALTEARAAKDPVVAELALWTHDAIHDVRRRDSEERSGGLASECARAMGLGEARRAALRELVLATRHVAPPKPGDEALVVDADLAILAATPARFDEFERQVRHEHAHVPSPLFRRVRSGILRGLLGRPRIFATEGMRGAEAQARENLRRSLATPLR